MSLLCPSSSSSWAARQPGKALMRPPAQVPWLAGPPGVTRIAHFTMSAQLGRSPSGFLLGAGQIPLPQWWASLGL